MFEFLEEAGVLGDPVGLEVELVIDWPDAPPPSEASDDALIRSVREAGGRVFVGFKEPELPPLAATVTGPVGQRRARIRPVSAGTILAGREVIMARGGVITRPYRALPFVAAVIDPAAAPELRRHPLVDWVASPGSGRVATARRSVTSQVIPANIDRIRAPQAWAANRGEGARIWILDTGTYGGFNHHPDLPQLNPFTCLTTIPGRTDCEDVVRHPLAPHGTQVAGVALALDNAIDVVGVAPAVGLFGSIAVCANPQLCDDQPLVDAVEFLRQNGVKDVVNMSICNAFHQGTATAVAAAWSAGDVLVSIAGNVDGCENAAPGIVSFPGAYSDVIAVSGTTLGDAFHTGSASGLEVELSAPFCVTTTSVDFATEAFITEGGVCGTSFAAPAVSGMAALLWTQNPGWSNSQVRTKRQSSVVDLGAAGRDQFFGFGRIDTCLAVGVCAALLQISIAGPDSVRAGEHCTWFGEATGGQGSFTYQWSGVLSGTSQQISGSLTSSGTLSLTVHSGDGQSDNANKFITVSSSAPSCGL